MADTFNVTKWAKDSIFVMDACNLSGVVHSFARMLSEMNAAGMDTNAKNRHPCSVMFATKVAELTGCEADGEFSKAYAQVKILAGE